MYLAFNHCILNKPIHEVLIAQLSRKHDFLCDWLVPEYRLESIAMLEYSILQKVSYLILV